MGCKLKSADRQEGDRKRERKGGGGKEGVDKGLDGYMMDRWMNGRGDKWVDSSLSSSLPLFTLKAHLPCFFSAENTFKLTKGTRGSYIYMHENTHINAIHTHL